MFFLNEKLHRSIFHLNFLTWTVRSRSPGRIGRIPISHARNDPWTGHVIRHQLALIVRQAVPLYRSDQFFSMISTYITKHGQVLFTVSSKLY